MIEGHIVVKRHGDLREVGVSKTTVWRWQEYFAESGVEGLVKGRSKPPGRKPISAPIKLKVVEKTVKERPVNATHWSVRTMAKEMSFKVAYAWLGAKPVHASFRFIPVLLSCVILKRVGERL